MSESKLTFCRICEPECSIRAQFNDDGHLTALEPVPDHPAGGVACHKGLSYLEVHQDPDRVDWPQRRLNPRAEARGEFVDTTWDAAMAEIGTRIADLRQRFGPNSVAVYMGNPFAFSTAAVAYLGAFQDALDTEMRFNAGTQDSNCKLICLSEIYGTSHTFLIPDIYHTDYLLCLGGNPKVSRWTFMSTGNDWEVVKDIKRRGGKVRFVNPRQIESSSIETGPTILIRPGTDVYFLAAVLNEIEASNGFDNDLVQRYTKNIDGLRAFIADYPAAKVAGITGIGADTIKTVAAELVAAPSAAVYLATGTFQSRQGVLCTWLVEMLNLVTGNLGQKGGTIKTAGLFDHYMPMLGRKKVVTSIGEFYLSDPIGHSALPASVLPDLIEGGDIRALIVLGGNPLLTVGGGERLRLALEKLDFMVCADIYRSVTGEMADFILPSADWLERPDINLLGSGMQSIPFIKFTEAMVEPHAGRRNDWWILARLAQAIGLPSPLDGGEPAADGPRDMLDGMLVAGNLSIDRLMAEPYQGVKLPDIAPETFFERALLHADGKIDCCPAAFLASGLFERCRAIFAELSSEPPGALKLISLRTPYMHNSWLANSKKFRIGKNAENPLFMREADVAKLGLFSGDRVRVSNDFGSVEAQIFINDGLAVGTVAMSHGFGNQRAYSLSTAQLHPGANCNALMPTGPGRFEPLSHMSWVSGVPVTVEGLTDRGSAAEDHPGLGSIMEAKQLTTTN